MARSRSQDDGGGDVHVTTGSSRGRIARQGARMIRSRSPSLSPSRHTSPFSSPIQSQTYMTKCDSLESLSNDGEHAALLKESEKSKSHSSLLIFFDGSDVQDTCV
eukprot:GHVU01076413.1.p1 GENE.GHVU01076413.1~~GHVU01076413.1.p1  ORF type:complete len:105 (+),score=12.53 GHVU01076413.1:1-315(+)